MFTTTIIQLIFHILCSIFYADASTKVFFSFQMVVVLSVIFLVIRARFPFEDVVFSNILSRGKFEYENFPSFDGTFLI